MGCVLHPVTGPAPCFSGQFCSFISSSKLLSAERLKILDNALRYSHHRAAQFSPVVRQILTHFLKEWGLAGHVWQHTLTEAVLQSVEFSRLLFPQTNFYLVIFVPNKNKGNHNVDLCNIIAICQIEALWKVLSKYAEIHFFSKYTRGPL